MLDKKETPLLVITDDDEEDRDLMAEALEATGCEAQIEFAADGVELLELLQRKHAEGIPTLVLLDINMPRMNGHEALEKLRAEDAYRVIPVVMLSTSGAQNDITSALRNGANAYVRKPGGFDDLVTAAEHIANFWLDLAERAAA